MRRRGTGQAWDPRGALPTAAQRRWILVNRLTGRMLARGTLLTLRRQRGLYRAWYAAYDLPCEPTIELERSLQRAGARTHLVLVRPERRVQATRPEPRRARPGLARLSPRLARTRFTTEEA
jgi:hypothetical protein